MNKPLVALKKAIILSVISVITAHFEIHAQAVGGSSTDINCLVGQAVIVDNALTITGGGTITNATVRVDEGFHAGDQLMIEDADIPGGGSSTFNASNGWLSISGTGTSAEWEAALRTVIYNTTSVTGGTRKITFTIGSAIYNEFNGHYYEYVTSGESWTNAKTAAEAKSLYGMPGYLATIGNQAENDFIQSKLQADGWIGCSDDYLQINAATGVTTYANQGAAEGNWYWVTGPEKGTLFSTGNFSPATVTYANWNGGEPNNWSTENYGQIYVGVNGMWNDLSNLNVLGYVVEYGGTGSDPVLDLENSRNLIVANPTLSGNSGTPGTFRANNHSYPVDVTIEFGNLSTVTDVTVSIAEGFGSNDLLEYNAALLPGTVSANYDAAKGVLSFTGTADVADWNSLLQSITFKSTSPGNADRKISFTIGNIPASAEGHYYIMGNSTTYFEDVPHYLEWYEPSLSNYHDLNGYPVNINSAEENDFILQKIGADFWLPLSDGPYMINEATNNYIYNDPSETEGQFYWLTGPAKGVLASTGDAPSVTVEPGQYINWQTNEPDNNGYYGEASYFSAVNGKWYDETLYDDFDYIYKTTLIEYGGMPGDPAFPLFFARNMVNLSTLPVTLTRFEVHKDNANAVADWSTESELDYSYFHLQRSTDNRSFLPIAKINGRGNNQGRQDYRFIDTHPAYGANYYRLKMVNDDSTVSYSPTRMVQFGATGKGNKVYPTIVSNDLHVELANPDGTHCTILTATGALVKRINTVSSAFTISVETLPRGSYILSIIDASGKKDNWTFIRQ